MKTPSWMLSALFLGLPLTVSAQEPSPDNAPAVPVPPAPVAPLPQAPAPVVVEAPDPLCPCPSQSPDGAGESARPCM
jgi:hypothetical protein